MGYRQPDGTDELLAPAADESFTAAGFRIAVIREPQPAPGARELFPDVAAKPNFLCFLFAVLQAG